MGRHVFGVPMVGNNVAPGAESGSVKRGAFLSHVAVWLRESGEAGRSKLLAVVLSVVVVYLGLGWLTPSNADSATEPMRVVSYTVQPGDTLWAYAASITPEGGDVSRTVRELIDLNELDSASLIPGQRIIVPAE